jgi:hypothetical protein
MDEVKRADKEWKVISTRLRMCLRQAAAIGRQRNEISEQEYDDFFVSGTDRVRFSLLLQCQFMCV